MDGFRRAGLVALLGAFVACEGALTEIEVDQQTSLVVPGRAEVEALLGEGATAPRHLELWQTADLSEAGIDPGDMASARLALLTVSVTAPADGDLSFLSHLAFYVEGPGLGRVRFASGDAFASGLRSVDLALDDVDLVPYLEGTSITFLLEADGHPPDEALTLEVAFVVGIGVTQQGACSGIGTQRAG
jgi:hypothetical protein